MAVLRSVIRGVGAYLPQRVLTNDELSKMVDTNDAWITERTGIKQRRIAAPGETASDMGAAAARQALERLGLRDPVLDALPGPELLQRRLAVLAGRDGGDLAHGEAPSGSERGGEDQGVGFELASTAIAFLLWRFFGADEPLTAEDDQSARVAEYRAAYTLMDDASPQALQAFRDLHARYPDDPLVGYHLQRLAAGETGSLVVMGRK